MPQLTVSAVRPGVVVGGYTLVRKLGEGVAAEVYLGFAGESHAALTAAVKVYRAGGRAGDREVEALGRVRHPHVVQLTDIASAPGGSQCLLLERLEQGSLATLLAERSAVAPGEAVTILAPLLAAVDALHASGVAHGAISATRVLFRATGAPVLAGFSRSSLFEPDATAAQLAEQPEVRADRAAMAALIRAVVERTGSSGADSPAAVLEWLDAAVTEGYPDPFANELAEQLFAMAEPLPVRFGAEAAPAPVVPSRAVATTASFDDFPQRSTLFGAIGVADWVTDLLDGSPVEALRARLSSALRTVRRPVWWALGIVGAALMAALIFVPQGEGNSVASPPAPVETPLEAGQVEAGKIESGQVEAAPIMGDDPVAAVAALFEARERCLSDMSVLCLDTVLEPGSSALDRDASIVRELQNGGEIPDGVALAAPAPTLVERLGDSAIVSLGADPEHPLNGQPASVLLMKGEAGWRIRGYLPGGDRATER